MRISFALIAFVGAICLAGCSPGPQKAEQGPRVHKGPRASKGRRDLKA